MPDLSIAIQHTPGRADRRMWVQAMIEQLRSENPNIPVTVVEDTRREGCGRRIAARLRLPVMFRITSFCKMISHCAGTSSERSKK